jgi:hypothetical protein
MCKMSSPEVLRRVEELRLQKQREEEQKKQKELDDLQAKEQLRRECLQRYEVNLRDGRIDWEAQILFLFESFDKTKILEGFSPEKDLDSYINELRNKYSLQWMPINNKEAEIKQRILSLLSKNYEILYQHATHHEFDAEQEAQLIKESVRQVRDRGEYYVRINLSNDIASLYQPRRMKVENGVPKRRYWVSQMNYEDIYNIRLAIEKQAFHADFVTKQFTAILKPVIDQREDEKRRKHIELQEQKAAEKLQRQLKAFQQLEKLATEHCSYTTYKHLEIKDYNKQFTLDVLKKTGTSWYHYRLQYASETSGGGFCISGPTQEMADWYEEGKVPFLTKCPVCKTQTNFNFVKTQDMMPFGNSNSTNPNFSEVFCPHNHYFFNTRNEKHYVSGGKEVIKIDRGNPGDVKRFVCWEPGQGGWKEWDSEDPYGSKEKEEEKNALQHQIRMLTQKLKSLS